LRPRLPHAMLLLSLAFPDAVKLLTADPAPATSIDGVSVFQGLVDANLVAWVHQKGLIVLAWTVDDGRRLGQLVDLGVDGITTANLAVLRALA
ncbi:MAG: glycerophosphodiester phosphodiesterase, partial [Kineosporiaceae bacterium]